LRRSLDGKEFKGAVEISHKNYKKCKKEDEEKKLHKTKKTRTVGSSLDMY
jgi:hypothetical protein